MGLPPYVFVSRESEWRDCVRSLIREPRLAIDLEANSMFAYRESVCLIQISTPTQDYIIDPTRSLDLEPLGDLISEGRIEKIFHAAEYDLILIQRQFGWELNNLFDTMWAARILGYKRFGLANLLKDLFNVSLDKRYQKSNWCRRPLSPAQLAYAQHDTHYLFELRDHLAAELHDRECTAEAAELFQEQTVVKLSDNGFDPDSFWSINGARKLSARQKATLRALNIFRDSEARRRDQPLFKVFSERTLFELAKGLPRNKSQLASVHGMSQRQINRYGDQILKVIVDARHDPTPVYKNKNRRPSEAVSNRYDKLRDWRKRRARRRGVESDVILSRDAMWELARTNPCDMSEIDRIQSMGEWRKATYGDEILEVLRQS